MKTSSVAFLSVGTIIFVAELILDVRISSFRTQDGSKEVKKHASSDWTSDITRNAVAAFDLELESMEQDIDISNDVPTQSPQLQVFGIGKLKEFSFWGQNGFCKAIQNVTVPDDAVAITPTVLPVVVNFTFGCKQLFKNSDLGTGNWVSAFYAMRMAAMVHGGIDVLMTCPDAEEEKKSLIVPWLMGYFPAQTSNSQIKSPLLRRDDNDVAPTLNKACGDYNSCPIGYMIPYVRHELRRMAIALIGIPYEDHPAAAFSKKYMQRQSSHGSGIMGTKMQLAATSQDEPLFPGIQVDDAVLHMRCGDLMMSNHPSFGFMKFSAFSKRLDKDTKSIGIVTQPFDLDGQTRKEDNGATKLKNCRMLVHKFQDHLAEKFPDARIRIHNDRNETIALTYARMIMAKQTISPISSFSVFPALATFGKGYIRKPDFRKAPNRWLNAPPVDQLYDNIELMVEPNRLMVAQIKVLRRLPGGNNNVFEWFQNDTFCLGPCKE